MDRIESSPASGDTVKVYSATGEFLAHAAYNTQSQISARVWSWKSDEKIDRDFFRSKITQALALRKELDLLPAHESEIAEKGEGARLIHAESDGLPGLIVDQYGDVIVMQLGSAGAERWRDTCADILQELCKPACIYERSDSDSRALEGLPERNGVLRGSLPPENFVMWKRYAGPALVVSRMSG